MRKKGNLNDKKIATLKKPGRYGDGHGLYLQVRPGTEPGALRHSWLLRYELNGKERFHGLGPLHTVSLKDAREGSVSLTVVRQKAARALEATRSKSFRDCAEAYFDANADGWRNAKHRAQFVSTLNQYAYPIIGGVAVAKIDVGLVLQVLEQKFDDTIFWKARPETASRVRGRIERVLDWATVRGYRTGDNPARWRGYLKHALPERPNRAVHHSALPFIELPEFMAALREREGVAARALEFTILTAVRTGETIGAQWSEFDLAAKVWTIPAGRIKGGREHRVPLSDRGLEILQSLPREDNNPFVFVGPRTGGLSNMAMASVLHRMGRDDITVHGFRSTFRDWAAERTNYPNHVVEQALAHVVGNKVEAAYRRGDLFEKRRRLMADWARYIGKGATPGARVVSLRTGVR